MINGMSPGEYLFGKHIIYDNWTQLRKVALNFKHIYYSESITHKKEIRSYLQNLFSELKAITFSTVQINLTDNTQCYIYKWMFQEHFPCGLRHN